MNYNYTVVTRGPPLTIYHIDIIVQFYRLGLAKR